MQGERPLPLLVPSLFMLTMAASWSAFAQQSEVALLDSAASTGFDSLMDGEILQIVRTLNEEGIAQAKLAVDESDDAQIKQVAEMIIADHESSNEQIETIDNDSKDLELDGSDMSEMLANKTEETREALDSLDDAQFACAYLTRQVEQQQFALDTVSKELLPSAARTEVKSFLMMSILKLEHHLDMAREVRKSLAICAYGDDFPISSR